ncbi:membrane protein insertase YidC [Sulfurivermis fontis]|uniref:membrane protein insertase YidC n=1 Tax=Sulfurivermis fontis TaxID=1972068 RepID=UPI000FD728A7|nr:membrane protein insertase YidC [Sulfurivermis fontis]
MDFQRLLLVIALSFVLLMLYQAWQKDYGPQPPVPVATAQAPATANDLPTSSAAVVQEMREGLTSAKRVRVYTDVYTVEIDTQGGDLRRADLIKYPVSLDKKDEPTRLLDDSSALLFIAQSGLRPGSATTAEQVPDHYAVYQATQDEYRLADGQDELQVRLQWDDGKGVEVDKIYTFRRGDYVINVDYAVRNKTQQPWVAHAYYQLQRQRPSESTGAFGIYTYTGGVVHGKELKYEKIDFDAMDKAAFNRTLTGGWAAMIQHYFVAAWIPPQQAQHDYYSRALGNNRYLLGMIDQGMQVAPGAEGRYQARLYVGPKLQAEMSDIADGLALTVDYGKLTFIADPIFWLLKQINKLVDNWGWSIVILTLLIKLAFFKLSATSYKSMAHMRKMTPRMQALKERYGDDRQKLNEAMMKLYKEEKINPLGGCLPILVQIPVFIALYWVLLESVELRQAPWILWIKDLSTMDPYYVLPILMGISMLIQHRLNPTPMDPIQAKVMMALPIVFTFFFAFFPSGLVLYWVVNNVLSVAQQWYITRYVVKA